MARGIGRMDHAFSVRPDVFNQAILLGLGRQQHLKELCVCNGHDHVQVGKSIQRVPAVMQLVVEVKRFRQMDSFNQGRYAALDVYIATQKICGSLFHPRRLITLETGNIFRQRKRQGGATS